MYVERLQSTPAEVSMAAMQFRNMYWCACVCFFKQVLIRKLSSGQGWPQACAQTGSECKDFRGLTTAPHSHLCKDLHPSDVFVAWVLGGFLSI